MPENLEQEIRTFPVELRTNDKGEIAGYAAVYNSISEDLGGWKEVIEPGFFRDVLDGDVRALFNHDDNYVLGRTRSKTLALKDENQGLHVSMKAPDTQWANDLRTSMQRGDIDQMSFAFQVKSGGAKWEERPDGTFLRRLLPGGAARLYDVSVVTFPAYPQTSAFTRSQFEKIKEGSTGKVEMPDPASQPYTSTELKLRRARLNLLSLE